jgi:uncharacterized protein with HEPN domain
MSKVSRKRKLLKKEFKQNLEELRLSLRVLNYSFEKCSKIGIKDDYSDEELESYESLTSRFARTSDIFTQKTLTTLFILIKETPRSFIDKANLSEKLGVIDSSTKLQEIRELRNEISHEYSMRDITEIFDDVLKHTANLKKIIDSALSYIEKNIPLNDEENIEIEQEDIETDVNDDDA